MAGFEQGDLKMSGSTGYEDEEGKLWLGEHLIDKHDTVRFEDYKSAVKSALFNEAERLVAEAGQKVPPVNSEIVANERKVR